MSIPREPGHKLRPSRKRRTTRIVGVGVQNFRAFQDAVYLPIAPLTLIFGANSSGKTSLLNALKFLRQSAFRSELISRGLYVDLGRPEDVPNHNTPDLPVRIRVDIESPFEQTAFADSMLAEWLRSPQGERSCGIGIEISPPTKSLRAQAIELFIGNRNIPIARWQDKNGLDDEDPSETTISGPRFMAKMSASTVDDEHPMWQWFTKEFGAKCLVGMVLNHCREPYDPEEIVKLDLPGIEMFMPELNTLFGELVMNAREHYVGEYLPPDERGHSKPSWVPELDALFSGGVETAFVNEMLKSANLALTKEAGKQFSQLIAKANTLTSFIYRSWVPVEPVPVSPEIRSHPLWETWPKDAPGINISSDLWLVANSVRDSLDRMKILSADRKVNQRYYVQGDTNSDFGSGSGIGALMANDEPQRILDKVNLRLEQAGISIQYEAVKWEPPKSGGAMPAIVAISVRDSSSKRRSIVDVGRGTQDLLPIALTLLDKSKEAISRLMIIEEPESHLHPALQQAVGSLLIAAVADSQATVIIETHSEPLLRRVLSHVDGTREPVVESAHVSLAYVSRQDDASYVEVIRLDKEGHVIDEWPFAAKRDGYAPFD